MQNRKLKNPETLVTEAMVAQAGVDWLRLNGWQVHRVTADRWKGGNNKRHEREPEAGVPDYIVTRPHILDMLGESITWYWEAKRTKGGKIRPSQIEWVNNHPAQLVCYANSLDALAAFVANHFPYVPVRVRVA